MLASYHPADNHMSPTYCLSQAKVDGMSTYYTPEQKELEKGHASVGWGRNLKSFILKAF